MNARIHVLSESFEVPSEAGNGVIGELIYRGRVALLLLLIYHRCFAVIG
jgi:hypothetical protein